MIHTYDYDGGVESISRLNFLGETSSSVVLNINSDNSIYEMPKADVDTIEALKAFIEQSASSGSWITVPKN